MAAIVFRATLVVLVWLTVAAGEAAATPGWAAPETIGTGRVGGANFLAMDLTPAGAATVLWRGTVAGKPTILATLREPDGTFTAPVALSRGTTDVGRPTVAVSPRGHAVAAWAQKDIVDRWVVNAAIRTPAGTWTGAQPIATQVDDPPDPVAAISDAGAAVVIWRGAEVLTAGVIQVAEHPPGGSWSIEHRLTADGRRGAEPHVVVDGKGDATALWLDRDSGSATPDAGLPVTSVRPAGGSWPPPQPRSPNGAKRPDLAIGADGTVAAIWENHSTVEIEAALRPPQGPWQPPQSVGTPIGSYPGEGPEIALDGFGNATVAWGPIGIVRTNRRPAGGTWGTTPQPLPVGYAGQVEYPAIAANARGFTLVGYLGRPDFGFPIVHGATRQFAQPSWAGPIDVGRPGGLVGLDVDADGHGLVAWVDTAGAVNVRAYDPAPPVIEGLAVPASGVAGKAVAFAVAPHDRWARPVTTSWAFGDGGTGAGERPSHVFAAPGRYTVRVTAGDALGNATSAQRVIEVAPGPPVLSLERARFARAAFRRSHVPRKARVVVEGTLSAPLRASLRLRGSVRPRARRADLDLGVANLPAGRFSKRVRIPKRVASRLLPGRYRVTVANAAIPSATARLRLRAPRVGVVMRHRISKTRSGTNIISTDSAERLWASFTFAPGGRPRTELRAKWYAPGSRRPAGTFPAVSSPRVKKAISFWQNAAGLAPGRWRCVLADGDRVVDVVSVLIR